MLKRVVVISMSGHWARWNGTTPQIGGNNQRIKQHSRSSVTTPALSPAPVPPLFVHLWYTPLHYHISIHPPLSLSFLPSAALQKQHFLWVIRSVNIVLVVIGYEYSYIYLYLHLYKNCVCVRISRAVSETTHCCRGYSVAYTLLWSLFFKAERIKERVRDRMKEEGDEWQNCVKYSPILFDANHWLEVLLWFYILFSQSVKFPSVLVRDGIIFCVTLYSVWNRVYDCAHTLVALPWIAFLRLFIARTLVLCVTALQKNSQNSG